MRRCANKQCKYRSVYNYEKKSMKEMVYYESPSIELRLVALEKMIASSNDSKFKVSADTTGSKEEKWDETSFGSGFNIDM